MESIAKAVKILNEINMIDKLGGREDFFGMKKIFEIILKEEHEKKGLTRRAKPGDATYPYCFRGVGLYGNIVDWDILQNTLLLLRDKHSYSDDEFKQLANWYKDRSIDCAVINTGIRFFLREI